MTMQVFDNLKALRSAYPHCVLTIGKYDGMHLGHQQILQRVKTVAAELKLPSLVVLSEPQPEEFFAGKNAPARLLSFADKLGFLEGIGIDLVYKMNFDQQLSELSAEDFISDILSQGLGTKALIVGDDFHFGKNRKGDFNLLQAQGNQLGFSVEAAKEYLNGGLRVSSTLLRKKLESGDCEAACKLLKRPYHLSGQVIKGQQLGRELGYPTANLKTGINKLALEGVFAVTAELGQRCIEGVASVGYKPTIEGVHDLTVEVFLLNFNEDIYGEKLTVHFHKKIRDQEKFPDLQVLKSHIADDVEKVKLYFSAQKTINKNGVNGSVNNSEYRVGDVS
ncbi:MAG: bifunctional riboflavin kinase/FMN adenylyltransferase [SAR86 cluster bacterium]|uniref:Riboflavin biosynthesis protein n=1 Tax=SAR86 cluster bacterium TaxID=2030880 RepID=A0A2A5CGH4_9GAMM|nr:bifunctional riboflavin kinase/FAD synthetase [Gammaproteobacteria bacterium AH-315-E17]PCJ42601.1 MAG: bifunctional riboflavin kinase/FMN adenylyltransferase [SAR86 cluster bacterium]